MLAMACFLFSHSYVQAQKDYENVPHAFSDALFNQDCAIRDDSTGWIVGGYGKALYTQDAGKTWTRFKIDDVDLKSVAFDPVEQKWWASGAEGAIHFFDPQKKRWENSHEPLGETTFWRIRFSQEKEAGIMVSGSGLIARYDYAAREWVRCDSLLPNSVFDATFYQSDKAVICGQKAMLLMSRDGKFDQWENIMPVSARKLMEGKALY
jgi:photosystem II stability/assembly factor-like uncharacterized protein